MAPVAWAPRANFPALPYHSSTETVTFSHSLNLQTDIILGSESGPTQSAAAPTGGARFNNNITMDTDRITGQHVLMQSLNEEGVSGFVNTPGLTTGGTLDTTANNLSG